MVPSPTLPLELMQTLQSINLVVRELRQDSIALMKKINQLIFGRHEEDVWLQRRDVDEGSDCQPLGGIWFASEKQNLLYLEWHLCYQHRVE